MTALAWSAFILAGAVGAPARAIVGDYVRNRSAAAFPWGTLVVNATGSLLLGVITGLSLYHAFPATSRIVLGTGFCGAYTTFSTFTFETTRLLEDGAVAAAFLNAIGTAVTCAAAAAAGLALAAL